MNTVQFRKMTDYIWRLDCIMGRQERIAVFQVRDGGSLNQTPGKWLDLSEVGRLLTLVIGYWYKKGKH